MATHRRRLSWIFAAVGILLVCLVAWFIIHPRPARKAGPAAIPVTVATVSVQDVPDVITALGQAQAWASDNIVTQVSGVLLRVDFVEGTNVRVGQILAEVNPAPYRAALTQAQGVLERDRALLAGARADLARYKTLNGQDSIARQVYEDEVALVGQDEGIVRADEGAVSAAAINLRWCRITSPIAGRTGVRTIDVGNYVSSSSPGSTTSGATGSTTTPTGIVIVNQIEPIAVTFALPQGDYSRIRTLSDNFRKPLAVQALSQESGASLGTGDLTIADNRVVSTTGTVLMKARFVNAGDQLLPGQFVNVQLTLQTISHAVTIPTTAVNQGPTGVFAYVVGPDHKVSIRPIKVGQTYGQAVVITTGLKAGETVVTDGQMSLDAGSLVRTGPAPATKNAGS